MKLSLVQDTFFLTEKAKITSYLIDLLYGISLQIREASEGFAFPLEVLGRFPKVSKGENYLGFPYLVLDFPRMFGKTDTLAFRLFFWWGHFISASIYLSGTYLDQYKTRFLENCTTLQDESFVISCHADRWMHDLNHEHRPLKDMSSTKLTELLDRNRYLKVSLRLELSQIQDFEAFAKDSFVKLASLLF